MCKVKGCPTHLVVSAAKVERIEAERSSHEGSLSGGVPKGVHLPAYAWVVAKGAVQKLMAYCHLVNHGYVMRCRLIVLNIPAPTNSQSSVVS